MIATRDTLARCPARTRPRPLTAASGCNPRTRSDPYWDRDEADAPGLLRSLPLLGRARFQLPAAIAAAGFHEPSLVFHLGRDLLLVDGGEAALFLAEAPGGLAIVERDQQTAFLDMADSLELDVDAVRQIEGFNMSKGKNVLIFLYRAGAFDPGGVSG